MQDQGVAVSGARKTVVREPLGAILKPDGPWAGEGRHTLPEYREVCRKSSVLYDVVQGHDGAI